APVGSSSIVTRRRNVHQNHCRCRGQKKLVTLGEQVRHFAAKATRDEASRARPPTASARSGLVAGHGRGGRPTIRSGNDQPESIRRQAATRPSAAHARHSSASSFPAPPRTPPPRASPPLAPRSPPA